MKRTDELNNLRGNLFSEYVSGEDIERATHMLAQVSLYKYCMISLDTGNRHMNPSSDYNEVMENFYPVKGAKLVTKKLDKQTLKFMNFNTRRPYTVEGQQIVCMFDGQWIYFADLDRHIYGKWEHPTSEFNTASIMYAYDKGWYTNCSIPEELKAEIIRIGWDNKL